VLKVVASAICGALSIVCAAACILQESQMDEKDLAEKMMTMKTHMSNILYTLENFPKAVQRLSAILGGN
jgi:hypothetical protein